EQMPDDVDPASPSPGTRVVLDSDEATNPDLMVVLVSHDAFDWNSIDTLTTHVFDATRRISGDLVQHL
ncbi:MAG: hypothetical protein ABIR32_23560, partial [Ilumatobacteraceae bacterium]